MEENSNEKDRENLSMEEYPKIALSLAIFLSLEIEQF